MKKPLIQYINKITNQKHNNFIDFLESIQLLNEREKANLLGNIVWTLHQQELKEEEKEATENPLKKLELEAKNELIKLQFEQQMEEEEKEMQKIEQKIQDIYDVLLYIQEKIKSKKREQPVKLMDYIREEASCNYVDIYDYFSEINACGDKLKAVYFEELLAFIYRKQTETEQKTR